MVVEDLSGKTKKIKIEKEGGVIQVRARVLTQARRKATQVKKRAIQALAKTRVIRAPVKTRALQVQVKTKNQVRIRSLAPKIRNQVQETMIDLVRTKVTIISKEAILRKRTDRVQPQSHKILLKARTE